MVVEMKTKSVKVYMRIIKDVSRVTFYDFRFVCARMYQNGRNCQKSRKEAKVEIIKNLHEEK